MKKTGAARRTEAVSSGPLKDSGKKQALTKVCGDCGRRKPIDAFTRYAYANRYALKDGTVKVYSGVRTTAYCGVCMGARSVVWRTSNPERFRAYQREYYRAKRAKNKLTKHHD
jgi:hypothetical protein